MRAAPAAIVDTDTACVRPQPSGRAENSKSSALIERTGRAMHASGPAGCRGSMGWDSFAACALKIEPNVFQWLFSLLPTKSKTASTATSSVPIAMSANPWISSSFPKLRVSSGCIGSF